MMHESMQQSDKQKQNHHPYMQQDKMGRQDMGRGMMGRQDMGMGRGMMDGMGMGRGMMGCMGMGPGMMDGYHGMGMGMMGGMGPMMHHHMMGGADGPIIENFDSLEDFETFLDETKEQRRKLHNMRFEYMEKMRQPETTVGELKQMKKETYSLMEEIHKKAESYTEQQKQQ